MQKGESQNGCFKKTKHTKFSEKKNMKLETPVLRFALFPYYRQILTSIYAQDFSYIFYRSVLTKK